MKRRFIYSWYKDQTLICTSFNASTSGLIKYGQVWTWGAGSYGQLGINSLMSVCIPVSIKGVKKTFCKIEAGANHFLVLDKTGLVWSWGYNNNGQLGDNSITSRLTPVSILGAKKTFCTINSNYFSNVGLEKNGQVWAWGNNGYGQLGDNSITLRLTPVSILGAKKTFCQIVSGSNHSIGLDYKGRVWGWGYNVDGELGDGTVVSKRTPVSIIGANKTFCYIDSGNYHIFGIDKNGQMWSWGYNAYGQLGIYSVLAKCTPTSIMGAKKTFCLISGGYRHAAAIDYTGQIWTWGLNQYGELGDSTNNNSRCTPVSILGAKKTFCSIKCGQYETIAVDYKGQVWMWGYNLYGSLGYGNSSVTCKLTPVMVCQQLWPSINAYATYNNSYLIKNNKNWSWGAGNYGQLGNNSVSSTITPAYIRGTNKTFCDITGGNLNVSVLDNRGLVWSWGGNTYGQLGDNSVTSKLTPVSILGAKKTFCQISSGNLNIIATDYRGQVWSWGYNAYGNLGDNSITNTSTPVSIMGAKKTFCQISSGIYYSVAIDNRGLVWGWGYNLYGQLGDNSVTSKRTPVSILGAKKTFCQINAAQYFTTSIDQYGLLWTWGLNNYGQLGINSSVYKCTPVSILGNRKTFCSVKSKYQHTLAIDNRGLVWGWGYGRDGQLWDKTTLSARTPVSILGSRKTFCSVGTGLWHGIGIDNNGYTWTWGLNNYGQLGNYYILSVCTPVSIKGAKKTFCKVDTGTYNVVTIDYKGQVWSWGYNAYGQLGNNATQSEISPVSILGVKKTFCEIAGAYTHSLGIDNRGLLWAWGYNNAGQLGVYSVTSKRTPVSILGAKKTFCQISSGDYFSIAIDNRGLVWGWGNDIYGQLGDYSITCKCTPLSIMGAKKTFCQINSDYYSVMGIDNRGLVWSWGYNNYGQLGDNSITNRCTPVSIMGAKKTFCKIDVGYNQSSAIDYKGQVWSWGYNAYGQLGDNSVTSKRTPVSILGAKKTFCSIVSGAGHSLGLDNRGQVWVWGLNNYGQLGDNVTTNRSTPISIMGAKKTFCQIHAGYTHSIAVDNRGIAWGWGGNGYGQVGFRRFDSLTPVRVCTI